MNAEHERTKRSLSSSSSSSFLARRDLRSFCNAWRKRVSHTARLKWTTTSTRWHRPSKTQKLIWIVITIEQDTHRDNFSAIFGFFFHLANFFVQVLHSRKSSKCVGPAYCYVFLSSIPSVYHSQSTKRPGNQTRKETIDWACNQPLWDLQTALRQMCRHISKTWYSWFIHLITSVDNQSRILFTLPAVPHSRRAHQRCPQSFHQLEKSVRWFVATVNACVCVCVCASSYAACGQTILLYLLMVLIDGKRFVHFNFAVKFAHLDVDVAAIINRGLDGILKTNYLLLQFRNFRCHDAWVVMWLWKQNRAMLRMNIVTRISPKPTFIDSVLLYCRNRWWRSCFLEIAVCESMKKAHRG